MPGSTRPLVKIGLLAPFEGLHRPLGYEVLYAVKLAIQERNDAGGVAGWGVELVALDDGFDPEEARRAAEKRAADKGVMGVIGPFSAATADAAAPMLARSALPWIAVGPVNATTLGTSRPYGFRLFASNAVLAEAIGSYAVMQARARRPVLVRAGGDDLADAVAAILRRQGLMLVADVVWDKPGWDALKEASPDLLIVTGDVEAVADFIVGAREQGIQAPVVSGPEAGRDILRQRAGVAAEGLVWVSSAPAVRSMTLAASFVEGYRALAGKEPGPYAALAYDATQVLLDALADDTRHDAGPTRRGVANALSVAQRRGLVGFVSFAPEGGWLSAPVFAYRLSQGNLVAPP
ncbi:MAG: branched-chain amino acid ABC transporter substrate-binding protein [Anaerolineae bacterium]|nr:branched-chain amino acid ABC transporter substrate-binding protein [Anaerolineae bacterium]